MMLEIPLEIAQKYSMAPLQQYLDDFGDNALTKATYLETFLHQTRDAENEAMDHFLAGEAVPDALSALLVLKKEARAALQAL